MKDSVESVKQQNSRLTEEGRKDSDSQGVGIQAERVEADPAAGLDKFHALYDLAVAMTGERSLDENLSLVVEKSRELLGGDTSYIALRDEEAGDVYMHTLSGIRTEAFKKMRIPFGAGLGGKVATTGRGYIVHDYFREVGPAVHDVVRDEGVISGIAVPVQIGQTNLGVLYVFNRATTTFSKSDLDTLSLLGNLAAVEITHKRAVQELRKAHADLERRVEERTAELKSMNERLLQEIVERKRAEESLQESEKRYRQLVDEAGDLIYATDSNGFFKLVNPKGLLVTGYSEEEMIGRHYLDVVRADFRNHVARFYGVQFVKKIPDTYFELPIVTKQGKTIWVGQHVHLIVEGDAPAGFQSICRDITERRKAEQGLRYSERRFRLLAEAAPFGLSLMSKDLTFSYFNPKFTEIFGYSIDDIPDKDSWFLKAYPDEDYREKVHTTWKHDTVERAVVGEVKPRVFAVRCKDGSDKIVHFRAVVMEDGSQILTYEDITAQAKTEEALRQSEERFRHLYEESKRAEELYRSLHNSSPDAIVIYDLEGKTQYLNDSFTRMFGWTLHEVEGRAIPFLPDSEREATMASIHRVLREGKPEAGFETRRLTKDGRVLDVSISATRYRDHEGNPAGTLAVLRDMTERKQAERLLLQAERIQAVGDMAGGVAHNFNNLLQIVVGRVQIALQRLESGSLSEVKANLTHVLEGAKLGAQTVARLQDFARVRTEDPTLAGKAFDLAETALEAIEISRALWETEAERDGIRIAVTHSLDTGCLVTGNRNELFEVVLNFIKNSVEALPRGGSIHVSTAVEREHVVLAVRDNGVGIAEEDLGRIFEPFWTTKGVKGTGLGLASSYGIVRRHGGSIEAESKPGDGAVFMVGLPLAVDPGEEMADDVDLKLDFSLAILIIDDNEPVAAMLADGLTEFGQTVYTALSGPEGIEIFRRKQIDVVICDLGMPEMTGWQVGEAIGGLCKERNVPRPPFILLTGWGGQLEEQQKIAESGVDRIVEKPVVLPRLLKLIREVLGEAAGRSGETQPDPSAREG